PQGQALPRVDVTVEKNSEKTIGRRGLFQPKSAISAADNHFRIRRRGDDWLVANVTGARRALLTYEPFGSIGANRWPLQSGDRVDLLSATVVFESVDHIERRIRLKIVSPDRAEAVYTLDVGTANKGVLAYAGTPPAGWQAACTERSGPIAGLVLLRNVLTGQIESLQWAERLLARSAERTRLQLGGVLSCPGYYDVPRLGLQGTEPSELIVVERNGRFLLGSSVGGAIAVIRRGSCPPLGFQDIDWLVDDPPKRGRAKGCVADAGSGVPGMGKLKSVILGRTSYNVAVDKDRFTFTAATNIPIRFPEDLAPEIAAAAQTPVFVNVPDRAKWSGPLSRLFGIRPGLSPAFLVLFLPVLAIVGLEMLRRSDIYRWTEFTGVGFREASWSRKLRTALLLASVTLTAVTVSLLSEPLKIDAAQPDPRPLLGLVLVNFMVASAAIALVARASPLLMAFWIAMLVLFGFGLLNLAQLGFGADNTRFHDFFRSQLRVFALLPPAVVVAASLRLAFVRQFFAPFFTADRGPLTQEQRASLAYGGSGRPRRGLVWLGGRLLSWLARAVWIVALLVLIAGCAACIGLAAMSALNLQRFVPGLDRSTWTWLGYAILSFAMVVLVYRLPAFGFSIKALPLFLLTLVFLAWLALGGEEGLGPFQPAELGKFAAVAFLALFLIALARRQDDLEPVVPLGVLAAYVAAIALYIGLFLGIPYLKSDLSPILIVGLTSILMVVFAGAGQAANILFGSWASKETLRAWAPWVGPAGRLTYPTHLPPFYGKRLEPVKIPGLNFKVPLDWTGPAFRIAVFAAVVGGGGWLVRDIFRPFLLDDYPKAQRRLEPLLGAEGLSSLAGRALSFRDLEFERQGRINKETGREERLVDYPDIGLQVVSSRIAIAEAPCISLGDMLGDVRRFRLVATVLGPPPKQPQSAPASGEDDSSFLGIPCKSAGAVPVFGRNSDVVMRIPVVKDDFAGAFFINRFGLQASFLLSAVQAVAVVLMLIGALRVRRRTPGDRSEEATRSVLFGMILGGAILLAIHWAISWSNQLGLLPVMGQPMTFLSFGGSHLGLMAFPLVVIAIVAFRVGDEPFSGHSPFVPPEPR
ncbi:MAG: hypothetical protein ACREC6_08670, partial [Hyphomicrobiaceae bacterium]